MTVLELVRSALRMSAAMNPGETPAPNESTDALFVLNTMIDGWNADRLNIYTINSALYSLVSNQQSYTIGVGGDWNAARPIEITKANLLVPSGTTTVRRPMDLVDDREWGSIRVQSVSTAIPYKLYNDGSFPLSRLYFWPTPTSAYQVELYTWQALTGFTATSDTFSMPPGYADAVRYNLGVRIAMEWGRELNPGVAKLAMDTLGWVKSLNAPSPRMRCDTAARGGSGGGLYNYLTGLSNG